MTEKSKILDLYSGKRIMVVEDEYFLADEVRRKLKALGAVVIGPVAHVDAALELIDGNHVDAAILDVHLGTDLVFPVADRLEELDVPFVFATAYSPDIIPEKFNGFALCEKPFELEKIATALWRDHGRKIQ